jgi:hypothetical protein
MTTCELAASARQSRSLRLSIPEVMYAEIEKLAKITSTSVAESARMVMGFGLAAVDALAEAEARRETP